MHGNVQDVRYDQNLAAFRIRDAINPWLKHYLLNKFAGKANKY